MRRLNRRGRRRRLFRILMAMLLATVGIALALAGYIFGFGEPPSPPVPVAVTPQQQEHTQAVIREWRAAIAAPPHSPPRKVILTQKDANTIIATHNSARLQEVVQQPSVSFSPGQVTISGYVPWHSRVVPVEVTGIPVARGGQAGFMVESVHLRGVPAPGVLRDRVQKKIDALLKSHASSVPPLSAVAVEEGQVAVEVQGSMQEPRRH